MEDIVIHSSSSLRVHIQRHVNMISYNWEEGKCYRSHSVLRFPIRYATNLAKFYLGPLYGIFHLFLFFPSTGTSPLRLTGVTLATLPLLHQQFPPGGALAIVTRHFGAPDNLSLSLRFKGKSLRTTSTFLGEMEKSRLNSRHVACEVSPPLNFRLLRLRRGCGWALTHFALSLRQSRTEMGVREK